MTTVGEISQNGAKVQKMEYIEITTRVVFSIIYYTNECMICVLSYRIESNASFVRLSALV